jgi:parallel beta-helix repeat protein
VILENCTLTRGQKTAGQHAILQHGDTSAVTLRRCSLTNADIGLNVEAGTAVLEATSVSGMENGGVRIHGKLSEATLRKRSWIHDNGQYGIVVEDAATLTIEDCTVSKNRGPGLWIHSKGTGRLTKTTVSRNDGDGMLVQNGVIQLNHCRLEENRRAGLAVARDGRATITDSACNKNRENGIYASQGGSIDAKASDFDGNLYSGIGLGTDARITAHHCNARDNHRQGVVVGPGSDLLGLDLTLANNHKGPSIVDKDGRLVTRAGR